MQVTFLFQTNCKFYWKIPKKKLSMNQEEYFFFKESCKKQQPWAMK